MATTIERSTTADEQRVAVATTESAGRLTAMLRDSLPPIGLFVVFVAVWQLVVMLADIPPYLLPAPTAIVAAGIENRELLGLAMATTFVTALLGFGLAIVVGTGLAMLMSQSRIIERSLYPYAIMLQTIPIVAIAPILVIWVGNELLVLDLAVVQIPLAPKSVVLIAAIIALFPIISNTTVGLTSTDHNLLSMFELYNAGWWQRMRLLRFPAAMPYVMTGLRISSGLAVIGAIVGEFIAGIGGLRGGLGYLIVSAYNRVQVPYLFAAALASALLGLVIFIAISLLSARFLRHWHESAIRREA